MNTEICTPESCETPTEVFLKPRYNVASSDNGYTIEVALPGVPKSAVSIAAERGILTITGRRQDEVPEGWTRVHQEIGSGDFRLTLKLNAPIDESAIEARIANGVLNLNLPIAEAARPRTIEVK